MKILVAVKRVVDAKIKVRPLPDHSGVDVKLAKMAMNPFDEIAIEKLQATIGTSLSCWGRRFVF